MCFLYKTKNNNNLSAIASQFEEDNFFILEKCFLLFILNDANGVACLLNVLLVLKTTFTYLMEAEICSLRYHASNPIILMLSFSVCFL